MALDKLTLHTLLARINENLQTLDATTHQRTQEKQAAEQQVQSLTEELTRLEGARAYHAMIVEQIQLALKKADEECAPEATSTAK